MRIITGLYKGRRFEVPRTFKARPTTDFAKENIFNVLTAYVDFEGATALDLFSGTGSITLELVSRGCSQVVSVELDRDHHRFIKQCIGKLFPEHRINTDLHGQSEEIRINPMPNPNGQSEDIRVNPMPNIQCIRGDVFRFIKSCHTQFDLIFADPPYALKELPKIPSLVLGTPPSDEEKAAANSCVPSVASDQRSSASLFTLHSSLLKPGGVFVFEHGKDYDFSQHPNFVEHRSYGSVNFSIFRN